MESKDIERLLALKFNDLYSVADYNNVKINNERQYYSKELTNLVAAAIVVLPAILFFQLDLLSGSEGRKIGRYYKISVEADLSYGYRLKGVVLGHASLS